MEKAFYDSYDYRDYWQNRTYEDLSEKLAIKHLLKQIPSSQRINLIDIGGGFGRLSSYFGPSFQNCLLVDPSTKLLGEAKELFAKQVGLKTKQGSAEKLPVDSSAYDVALMVRVLHHLPNPRQAFLEAYRALKPQGFLLLEFANKTHFLSRLKSWLRGNTVFSNSLKPANLSTSADNIPFLNHHPMRIEEDLKQAGFTIIEGLSVSNFRSTLLKKIIPLPILLSMESTCQKPLFSLHFGPSLFLLCQRG